jgi:hypothetical protein
VYKSLLILNWKKPDDVNLKVEEEELNVWKIAVATECSKKKVNKLRKLN